MITYEVLDGVLHVGGNPIHLPFPVAQSIGLIDAVVVRLDVPAGQLFNCNVYLVGADGGIRWRVHESPHGTEDDKPFMNLWLTENGALVAGNWNGVDYDVDLRSGAIHARAFKR